MREYRSVIIALIAAVSAVACVMIFTSGLVDYKKSAAVLRPRARPAVILSRT